MEFLGGANPFPGLDPLDQMRLAMLSPTMGAAAPPATMPQGYPINLFEQSAFSAPGTAAMGQAPGLNPSVYQQGDMANQWSEMEAQMEAAMLSGDYSSANNLLNQAMQQQNAMLTSAEGQAGQSLQQFMNLESSWKAPAPGTSLYSFYEASLQQMEALSPQAGAPAGPAAPAVGRLQLNPHIAGPRNYSNVPGCKQEQCAEYVARYFSQSGKPLPWHGNAGDWWANSAGKAGYQRCPNGGGQRPQPGDILVFKGGSEGYGHVAIVTAVTDKGVEVQQANWGPNDNGHGRNVKHTFRFDAGSDKVYSGVGNLPIVGWIHPEGSHSLLT